MEGDPARTVLNLQHVYFNPLPPHGGRLLTRNSLTPEKFISIHSLRMEGDRMYEGKLAMDIDISIHSLRMEGD